MMMRQARRGVRRDDKIWSLAGPALLVYKDRMRCLLLACCLFACSGGAGGEEDRLIQRDDSEFSTLEQPEAPDECTATSQCEHSCVHSCVAESAGPVTCPVDPTPVPERLVGASCACADERCKWL